MKTALSWSSTTTRSRLGLPSPLSTAGKHGFTKGVQSVQDLQCLRLALFCVAYRVSSFRFFAGHKLSVEEWDGVTKYKVTETAEVSANLG